MKQNNKTKILKRVFALALCLIAVLSCIVIVPAADSYDDNFTHYRFSYEYNHNSDLSSYVSDTNDYFYFIIESPIQQKAVFNDPTSNSSYTLNFTDLAVGFSLIVRTETSHVVVYLDSSFQLNPHGTDEIFLTARTTFVDGVKTQTSYRYRNNDVIFEGTLQENGSPFVIDLWLDASYVSQVNSRKTDGSVLYAQDYVPLFTDVTLVSRPKFYEHGFSVGYQDGYFRGSSEGYDRGFNEGHDRGEEMGYGNGYQVGKQEGITEGFNTGREQGYSEGFSAGVTEGYDDGFDVGYDTGYDDGYLEGKNDQTPVIPQASQNDLMHLWLYFNATYYPALTAGYENARHVLFIDAPYNMNAAIIYGRNGTQNLFKFISYKKLAFDVCIGGITEGGVTYTERDVFVYFDTEFADGSFQSPKNVLRIHKEWHDGVYQGMTVSGTGLDEYGIENFTIEWDQSYGNYNLQLWIAPDYATDALTQNFANGNIFVKTLYQKLFTYKVISYPKTYAEGYISGVDFGLEEGYGNGYDQGNIDGIQQGKEEGYRDGYEEGYGFGFTDGNDEGYELGKDVGYENGYADAKKIYDDQKSWMNFKNLIFAIFDAPFYVISYALDFDIFGINIAGTLIALISTALIVWILKIIIVKLF